MDLEIKACMEDYHIFKLIDKSALTNPVCLPPLHISRGP